MPDSPSSRPLGANLPAASIFLLLAGLAAGPLATGEAPSSADDQRFVSVLVGADRVADGAVDPAVALRPPPLQSGDTGRWVNRLQHELTRLNLYRGKIDGDYGTETAYAVMAYHKVAGLDPAYEWRGEDWDLLANWKVEGILERHPEEPHRVEVDIGRQVLHIIRDGRIMATIPVSTANGATYFSEGAGGQYVAAYTPRGDFNINRRIDGWRFNYLGGLYKPWYFTEAYAIHGSNSVPSYPASHGCVRIPNWEADRLVNWLFIGIPVHTWDV